MPVKEFDDFVDELVNNYNPYDDTSRDKSYEICRKFFLKNKDDKTKYDDVTIYLFAYLASWGYA